MSDSLPNYPRGTPFKPPQESRTVPDSALRGFVMKVALGTLAAVAVIVAVGAFVVIRAVRPASPGPVAEKPVSTAIGREPESTRPVETTRTPATVKEPQEKPPAAKEPQEKPPEKKEPPPRDSLLGVVGGLLGADLRQGYINIGLLADAQENDVYSTEVAKQVLGSVVSVLDNVDLQIGKLTEAGLDDNDRKQLEQARKISALLRTQAKELRAFWETPEKDKDAKKDHETKYYKAREEAWNGIKELLDIKE